LWTALFALGLAAFTALAWVGIVREQYEALDGDLASTASFAAQRIAHHGIPTMRELQHADAPDAAIVVIRNGRAREIGARNLPSNAVHQLTTLPLNHGITLTNGGAMRAYAVALNGQPNARVVAIASTRTLQDEQRRFGYGFGVGALPILAFAVVIGALLAKRSLAPIENMRSVAAQIAGESTLTRRLDVHGSDELALLARTFNDMLERLEQSFSRERAFIGDVSHELRNSLAAIIAESDVALSKDRAAGAYSDALAAVVSRARRLASAVDDLLLLARADAGALSANERVDVNDVVARVCADAQKKLQGTPIAVELSKVPVTVLAREELIARAVENLVVNARHAARSRVALRVYRESSRAVVRVDDDGPGVPLDDQEKIFRRFERGAVEYAGSGLGLPLVAAIARAYGGRVTVDANVWNGASFVLELPLAPNAVMDSSSRDDTMGQPE